MRRSVEHQQRLSFLSTFLGSDGSVHCLMLFNVAAFATIAVLCRHWLFAVFALECLVIHLVRLRACRTFQAAEADLLVHRKARAWHRRALVLGAAYASIFGTASLVAVVVVPDTLALEFVTLLSIVNVIGVVSRSFGLKRLLRLQLLLMGAPITIALLLDGTVWSVSVAAFTLPVGLITDFLARHLRRGLIGVVNERAESAAMAERFSASLAAVPEGLVHLDAGGRIAVMNRKARTLFDLPETPTGRRLRDVAADTPSLLPAHRERLEDLLGGEATEIELQGWNGTRQVVRRIPTGDNTLLTITDVTERAAAEQRLMTMARTDHLTGLAARGWLSETLERDLAEGRRVLLALIDIDDFRSLNDAMGQRRGDDILRTLARLARETLPEEALAARLSGDEFAVLAPAEMQEAVQASIERLLSGFAGAGRSSGLPTLASAGIAVSDPSDTMDRLMSRTGVALAAAKTWRRTGAGADGEDVALRLFDEELHERHETRLATTAAFARALETGDGIHVAYQAVVDPLRGRIVAAEALCRWSDPELGAVSPATFIPIAEELGSIRRLTDIVLKRALAECATWPGSARVSVNLSAADIRDPELVTRVSDALNHARVRPERLQVEITETQAVRNDARTRRTLDALGAMGVRVALDDFGTGYSNLATLEGLPIHTVKLDRSLVARIGEGRSFEFLSGAIGLFRRLGLTVVVEGVETEAQIDRLAEIGGDTLVQGFVFGRPLSEGLVGQLMAQLPGQRRVRQRTISVGTG